MGTVTPEGNMETRQMTPFFSALFVAFIFVFENSLNSFSYSPLFGPFLPVKYLNFGQKLPIRTAHHTYIELRHPEVTKNPYFVLCPEESQKMVSAHGLICQQCSTSFFYKTIKNRNNRLNMSTLHLYKKF